MRKNPPTRRAELSEVLAAASRAARGNAPARTQAPLRRGFSFGRDVSASRNAELNLHLLKLSNERFHRSR